MSAAGAARLPLWALLTCPPPVLEPQACPVGSRSLFHSWALFTLELPSLVPTDPREMLPLPPPAPPAGVWGSDEQLGHGQHAFHNQAAHRSLATCIWSLKEGSNGHLYCGGSPITYLHLSIQRALWEIFFLVVGKKKNSQWHLYKAHNLFLKKKGRKKKIAPTKTGHRQEDALIEVELTLKVAFLTLNPGPSFQ